MLFGLLGDHREVFSDPDTGRSSPLGALLEARRLAGEFERESDEQEIPHRSCRNRQHSHHQEHIIFRSRGGFQICDHTDFVSLSSDICGPL